MVKVNYDGRLKFFLKEILGRLWEGSGEALGRLWGDPWPGSVQKFSGDSPSTNALKPLHMHST
jgi:hypothetical protein